MTARSLALVACAACTGSSTTTPPHGSSPTDIHDSWDLQAQSCDGTPLTGDPTLYYLFDGSHAVRVELMADDASHQCLIGYVYTRLISSASQGPEYEETAILSAAGTKTECWMKQDGVKVEPHTSEIGTFGPEEITMAMTATAETIELELVHAPACARGTLHVELLKR